jgi:multidrug efflux pump subunit AcrA (membrane-fusion protein)
MNQDNECLLCVSENHQVELIVPVSDFNIGLVETNQSVLLKVRTFIDRTFEGRVAHIPQDASADGREACFNVSAIVSNNNSLLQPGMTGYAKIEVGNKSLFGLILRKTASIIRVEFWSWW